MTAMRLFYREGHAWLDEEYSQKERSTCDIANELGTYPGLVRKALMTHSLPRRDRQEAQKAALKSGRHSHPTKGRGHTESARAKIAESWKDRKSGKEK